MEASIEKRALYVVATPLGNLEDITHRALRVLAGVDLVAAEDTRRSRRLLRHYGIQTPCLAFHEHNEARQALRLLRRIQEGAAVALVSDAGTPLISDPGLGLVRRVQEAGCRVIPIPGPSALTAALSAAGMPCERFAFEGFLPAKGAARRRRLEALRDEPRTLVFYEAPHRILDLLELLCEVLGEEREAALARELTKAFETIHRDRLGRLAAWVAADARQQKGEFVVVVAGERRTSEQQAGALKGVGGEAEAVLAILLERLTLKEAVSMAARLTGERRNQLYAQAVRLQRKAGGSGTPDAECDAEGKGMREA